MSDFDQWPDAEEEREEKKRRKGGIFLLVMAFLLILGAIGIVLWQWPSIQTMVSPPPNAKIDMRGNLVVPDEDAVMEDPTAVDDIGLGFKVVTEPDKTTILNVPLGKAQQINGRIAPPGFKSVYLITNIGVTLDNAEKGTVYTATHSLRNGGWAPGNALIDIERQKATVKPGDMIYISNRIYSVTETRIIPKPAVGGVQDIWDTTIPDRLIVFTCLQNPQNSPSKDNMIVFATLVQ